MNKLNEKVLDERLKENPGSNQKHKTLEEVMDISEYPFLVLFVLDDLFEISYVLFFQAFEEFLYFRFHYGVDNVGRTELDCLILYKSRDRR